MVALPPQTYEAEINSPVAEVWKALTTSEATQEWYFGNTVESDWDSGSELLYRGPDGEVDIECLITDIEPGVYFRGSFHPVWSPEVLHAPSSTVEWRLEGQGDSTLVTIIHSDLPTGSQVARETAVGWPHLLSSLKTYCESET
ncbi:SRPBCC domain-containing protein [Populibacterium corticicola]|uniref:SRPBCC domain-containing protein n=1 Tax=Populibacterium corticicola TaxID=1812826 RepID=A0ABW5XHK2_9MICO